MLYPVLKLWWWRVGWSSQKQIGFKDCREENKKKSEAWEKKQWEQRKKEAWEKNIQNEKH